MPTLRQLLPLPVDDLAAVCRLTVELVVRLHGRGHAHGAISLDDVIVTTTADGTIEVSLTSPRATADERDDVAALGWLMATALQRSSPPTAVVSASTSAVARAAHTARRAAIDPAVDAKAVLASLADAGAVVVPARRRRYETWRDRTPTSRRPQLALALWFALLVATVIGLPRLAPDVSPPPLVDGLSAVSLWIGERDLASAVVGTLRLVVHGLALYLLGSTLVSLAVQVAPSRAAHRLAIIERLTAAPARKLVHAALGVGLTFGALTTVRATPASDARPRPAEQRHETHTSAPATTAAIPGVVAVEHPEPAMPAPPPQPDTWTVAPGDSFWSIAEWRVSDQGPTVVDERTVTRYWLALIEANRDVLVAPELPDLILPGQVLRLPPVAAAA